MKVAHIHSSSRYDRSAESLRKAFSEYVKSAALVTFTEVEFEPRERALHAPYWKKVTGDESNRNDSAICWDTRRLELVHDEQFPIKGSVFARAGGKKVDQLYATIAVLEDGLGASFVVSVVHLPSSVEGDLAHGRKTGRTSAWYSAVRQVRKRTKTLKRKFKADACMIVADWNIDFKKPWARAVIKAAFPSWKLTWRQVEVRGGTHGKRIIDGTVIKGNYSIIKGAYLIADDDSSDHRPYREILGV